jgi:enoyl-CoA hydratase
MAIHLTRIDELAVVALDRPEVLNALNFELLRDLGAALDQVATGDARALLVTGAGDRAFCAGADVKELMGRSLRAQREGPAFGQAIFSSLDALPIPSIALICGYAFGGGLELALACTFRLAVESARLGLPEIKLGLIPGLWRYAASAAADRRSARARNHPDRPHRRGGGSRADRPNRIVKGDLIEAGASFAREMTGYSLPALCLARDAVHRGLAFPLKEGLEIEADLNTLTFQTTDAVEGMLAFLEKRKPAVRDG